LDPSKRKGIEYIEYSMDSNIQDKHEEEHQYSKKEIKVRKTN
jgi:hypothetical protein